jgi:hypothetical protein
MVLDDVLGDANDSADFAIGETFPQDCDLNLCLSIYLMISFEVRRSQGVMAVLPPSHGDSYFQALATLADSSAQEQRAQGLLHRAGAGG